jgi:glycine/D-amino acid oxidase-like deaminating enzyme
MTQVVVIGCGIVGAAIAYELSQVPRLQVTLLDRQPPAQAATGAALGVLMGVISQKLKGRNLEMRLAGIQRYNAWIPRLEASTGHRIPFNRQGILRLCFEGEDLTRWQSLVEVRQSQGWRLAMYDRSQIAASYPYLRLDGVTAAIYSPDDRQVAPTAVTLALVAAAQAAGVRCQFDAPVEKIEPWGNGYRILSASETLVCDWLVIAAGLGSTALVSHFQHPVAVRPVLGQAIRVMLPTPLAPAQPVVTGDDVHLVPIDERDYWIGATVEFPAGVAVPSPDAMALQAVLERAIAFCPAVADATITQTWSGLRPRPEGRPAPIIEPVVGQPRLILATGHYRNGVLLAPATAEQVRQLIAPLERWNN